MQEKTQKMVIAYWEGTSNQNRLKGAVCNKSFYNKNLKLKLIFGVFFFFKFPLISCLPHLKLALKVFDELLDVVVLVAANTSGVALVDGSFFPHSTASSEAKRGTPSSFSEPPIPAA